MAAVRTRRYENAACAANRDAEGAVGASVRSNGLSEWLSRDPEFRLIGPKKGWNRGVTLTPLADFEAEKLAGEESFAGVSAHQRQTYRQCRSIALLRRTRGHRL